VIVDEIIKYERIISAIIQACGIIVASFFIPKFLETRRHENDRKDRVVAKKEAALSKFISKVNWVLLNQSNYKFYYSKAYLQPLDSHEKKEKAEKYKKLVDDLYNKYIFCEEPYEVACALAQLEFPEVGAEITDFKEAIDTYIEKECTQEECTGENGEIASLFKRHAELTIKMTEILKFFRSDE